MKAVFWKNEILNGSGSLGKKSENFQDEASTQRTEICWSERAKRCISGQLTEIATTMKEEMAEDDNIDHMLMMYWPDK